MKQLKEFLRNTANIFIGLAVLAVLLPLLAFCAGAICKLIVNAYKYGYALW